MASLQLKLSALLVLQIAIAAFFFFLGQQKQGQYLQGLPMFSFQKQQLEKIVINSSDGSVSLHKKIGGWQLPALAQLPVDVSKLDLFLSKLETLKTSWPVTVTDTSHQRFEVAENQFQRRIQLYQKDGLVEDIFIGTAPRFRNAYIRRANDDAVYVVALNVYDMPVDAHAWLDQSLLSAGENISTIQGPDYTLEKNAGQWHFSSKKDIGKENTDESAKKQALALINLRVLAPANMPLKVTDQITLKASGSTNSWTYQFIQDDDSYYVSRNDRNTLFALSKLDYQRATGVSLKQETQEEDTGE